MRIRGFVKDMPSIDTERHELKQQLFDRFARPPDRGPVKAADQQQPAPSAKLGVDLVAPTGGKPPER